MDTRLTEQIQATIDALTLAQQEATLVTKKMRKQRIHFGLEYGDVDDDIAHILGKLRYLQRLAQRRELADAAMAIVDAKEPIPSAEDKESY